MTSIYDVFRRVIGFLILEVINLYLPRIYFLYGY